jgi:acetoin utilization deacetylase AcuC-like enzyme
VLEAVDRVLDGTFNKAFCCVRPPGHHAHRNKPGGFCIFNNVAIAALYALAVKGLKRVAVIDIDAHHGDGTEDILQNHEGVHFFSIYQEGIFPHVENTDCAPNVVRAVLKRGDNGDDACEMIRSQWLPQMQQFAPEMIFVSAGFDAHVADIQSGLDFSDLDYAHIIRIIDNVAETVCNKKLVSVLEGGYEPRSLARSVVAHLRTLSHL